MDDYYRRRTEGTSASLLDTAAFSQLFQAAQQCGLLSGVDAIAAVRDREFPAGHYQRSLDMIEPLFNQLQSKAARRQADLRQQETRYRAGTLKMSPREWQTKLRRDLEQSQAIDRAVRRFARVLDGLRVLRAANQSDAQQSHGAAAGRSEDATSFGGAERPAKNPEASAAPDRLREWIE